MTGARPYSTGCGAHESGREDGVHLNETPTSEVPLNAVGIGPIINLHIYPSPIRHESRMLKETWALAGAGFFDQIHLVGTYEDGLAEREALDEVRSVWRVPTRITQRWGLLGRLVVIGDWTRQVFEAYRCRRVRAVSCHNLASLPLGLAIARATGALLVYDTHELETERTGWALPTRLLAKLAEAILMRWVDYTVVVSESIGEWYRQRYRQHRFRVARNVPLVDRSAVIEDPDVDLRRTCGVPEGAICYLLQGVLGRGRGIEVLAEAFRATNSDAWLVLMGFAENVEFEAELRDLVERHPRMVWHPSVPPNRILSYTRTADVGLYTVEPASLSYRLTVGNKLFEYLMAGIPVIGSDFPEVRRILEDSGCGWTLPVEARGLRELIDSIDWSQVKEKRDRAQAFGAQLSWVREVEGMVRDYEELLGMQRSGTWPPR